MLKKLLVDHGANALVVPHRWRTFRHPGPIIIGTIWCNPDDRPSDL